MYQTDKTRGTPLHKAASVGHDASAPFSSTEEGERTRAQQERSLTPFRSCLEQHLLMDHQTRKSRQGTVSLGHRGGGHATRVRSSFG